MFHVEVELGFLDFVIHPCTCTTCVSLDVQFSASPPDFLSIIVVYSIWTSTLEVMMHRRCENLWHAYCSHSKYQLSRIVHLAYVTQLCRID